MQDKKDDKKGLRANHSYKNKRDNNLKSKYRGKIYSDKEMQKDLDIGFEDL
jgi:hypothetical protein